MLVLAAMLVVLHLVLVVAVMPVLLLVAVGLLCARGRGELRMHGLFFCTEHRPASIFYSIRGDRRFHL